MGGAIDMADGVAQACSLLRRRKLLPGMPYDATKSRARVGDALAGGAAFSRHSSNGRPDLGAACAIWVASSLCPMDCLQEKMFPSLCAAHAVQLT